jgi:hypothetical protein
MTVEAILIRVLYAGKNQAICLILHGSLLGYFLYPEDENDMFLRNVGSPQQILWDYHARINSYTTVYVTNTSFHKRSLTLHDTNRFVFT